MKYILQLLRTEFSEFEGCECRGELMKFLIEFTSLVIIFIYTYGTFFCKSYGFKKKLFTFLKVLKGVSTLLGQKNWFFLFCFIGQIYVPRILSKIFELQSVGLEKLSSAEESAVESRRTRLSGETDSRRSRFLRWEILSWRDCLFLDNVFGGRDAKI